MPKIDIDNYIEQSGMRKARFGGYEPEDVHQAMEDLCADYEQHLTAMTSELRTLRQENDALRRHAQGLVMQNQTLSTQNATLAGQVDKLQSYRANLETQFSTVKERSASRAAPMTRPASRSSRTVIRSLPTPRPRLRASASRPGTTRTRF